jgi:hypothetical protein
VSAQFNDIAFNLGVVATVVGIVVVPVVVSLQILDLVRRRQQTARGFEVQPVFPRGAITPGDRVANRHPAGSV